MARYSSSNNEPFTRWNNIPVYLTTILTALFVAGLLLTAVFGAMHSPLLRLLAFEMPLIPVWSVWRVATYVFVAQLSFFTPFAILCFYWWSLGIETHLGRQRLGMLLAALTLSGPVVGELWWVVGVRSISAGNYAFTCGLLVAFSTLYPSTEAWGWVPFKWIAFACILCGSLMLLADRDWVQLSQLWAACAIGFLYIRHAKEREYDDFQSPFAGLRKWFQRKPKLRVLPRPAAVHRSAQADSTASEMDTLLDKIARTGLASLSAKERARLEKAREALLKKDAR